MVSPIGLRAPCFGIPNLVQKSLDPVDTKGMRDYRFWLISTEHTILELREWQETHPDEGMPLSFELGEELTDLSERVLHTSMLLDLYAEWMGGKPVVLN